MTRRHIVIFTIGHSTHPLETLVSLLKQHGITALADVRSAPYSRFSPQFNKDALAHELEARGIRYVFLGRELGARAEDRALYENGRVRYARLAQTDLFKRGIARVMQGATKHCVALLCAEKEPLECHRTLVVARALDDQGVYVAHIHADGRLEAHQDAMERLLDLTGLPHEDLFLSRDDLIAKALARQEEKVAYADVKLAAETGGMG
jgi:uncharacterized protein (DUF488 family)